MRVAVLTVSDRASRGEYIDEAGPVVAGYFDEVVATDVVPDEQDRIEDRLRSWIGAVDLIVTTGGTGLGPRDVTPEATRAVIEREAPGLAEAMRAAGMAKTPNAALSRQACGIAGRTLIVNVPGSPKAAAECIEAIIEILPHAVEMMNP
jgi:molybdenum cofactor synthesis domain-containing protein